MEEGTAGIQPVTDEGAVVELPSSVLDKIATGIERIGVASLVQAGVIDIDEAREMVGIKALSASQKTKLITTLKWMKNTGKTGVPVGAFPYWYEALK